MAAQENENSLAETFWGFVALGVLGLLVGSILPDRWTDSIKYFIHYSVNRDQIHWNDKPADRDRGHAPLGDKGCHYKKTVSAYNAAGYLVAGDDAPIYGHVAKTGKPTISYNNGKSWDWLPAGTPAPDLTATSVEIGWTKAAE